LSLRTKGEIAAVTTLPRNDWLGGKAIAAVTTLPLNDWLSVKVIAASLHFISFLAMTTFFYLSLRAILSYASVAISKLRDEIASPGFYVLVVALKNFPAISFLFLFLNQI